MNELSFAPNLVASVSSFFSLVKIFIKNGIKMAQKRLHDLNYTTRSKHTTYFPLISLKNPLPSPPTERGILSIKENQKSSKCLVNGAKKEHPHNLTILSRVQLLVQTYKFLMHLFLTLGICSLRISF